MGEIIQPSYMYKSEPDSPARTLLYSPSLKSCIFAVSVNCFGVVSIDCQADVRRLAHSEGITDRNKFAISPDSSVMAMSARGLSPANELKTMLSLHQLPNVIAESHSLANRQSFCVEPDFACFLVSTLKFFPDGKRIIVSLIQDPFRDERIGSWCRIFDIPKDLWNGDQTATKSEDKPPYHRKFKEFKYVDIDVIQQGLVFPEIFENRTDVDIWPSKSAECGFYSLAISPDTTRILAGSYSGEIFIFETSTLKLLQRVRGYDYEFDVRVISCHYNPVFGHHQFVTCGHNFEVEIWSVDELEGGIEHAHIIHQLSLAQKRDPDFNGGCCCNYSPDGKLMAVTFENIKVQSFIIDSSSGQILYSLGYMDRCPLLFPEDHSLCHNMFVGNLCQVAAVSYDNQFCIWKLPVVYSLETLCFLAIKACVNYVEVDQLCLPSALELRLKYLYV